MYAELHCLSNFTFLRGASAPEELVQRAAALGYQALAITDECTLAGVVRAHVAAKAVGLQLIIGTELHIDGMHLVLLAPNRRAYGQISQLITLGRRRSAKGEYHLDAQDLLRNPQNFSEALPENLPENLPDTLSECLALWIPDTTQNRHDNFKVGEQLARCFPERLWLTLELHLHVDDLSKAAELLTLSSRLHLPLVAAGDVHMHDPARQPLQDVVTAIRLGTTVQEAGQQLMSNRERHLRPISALAAIYPEEMLDESLVIARRCHFSLDELRYEYPQEVVPPGLTPAVYLRQLVEHGARERWPDAVSPHVQELLEKELRIIGELAFEHYFLTVYDIVQYARSQHILCQGRGSAANSAVCYCLFITEVDPARMNVLFERFISKERQEPPDIDVDFEHERREEVIQYLYQRYGRHRAALAATVITYRPRSAIRDVGKALGLELALVDHLAKSLTWWDDRADLLARFTDAGIDPANPVIAQFLQLVQQILGFPRHLSQHVGGFVIAAGALADLVPIENAAMADRTVIQWDKDDLEALGLMKVDVLGLGMLTAIRRCIDLVNDYRGTDATHRNLPHDNSSQESPAHHDAALYHPPLSFSPLSFSNIPAEDPATYQMLQKADSVGVFQVESRAQMAMLPRLRPAQFYDLVVEVAIVRPGPIQGNMVHPYLRRRQGLEAVSYPSEAVRGVLERTLGVPIFQEQVIQLAMVAAGFGAGEADQLRRAMAAWRRRGGLEAFEEKLVSGMLARGHDRDFAERVFAQIKGFGEYGFPESHAASFALLVYISAWLKRHEPAAFCCGLLNSLPMGFYSPSQLTQDLRRHGIEVRAVDIATSQWNHTLEAPDSAAPTTAEIAYDYARRQPALRLGLRLIKGFDEAGARRIEAARAARPFASPEDLAQRAALDNGQLRRLAQAGALASLSGHRHDAHWAVHGVLPNSPLWQVRPKQRVAEPEPTYTEASLATSKSASASASALTSASALLASPDEVPDCLVDLPTPGLAEEMFADYATLGLSLRAHPMALLRKELRKELRNNAAFHRCTQTSALSPLPHGRFVRVAGVVTGRQRPSSASGVLFMTLEDETGNANVVIWNSVLARFRSIVLHARIVIVKGVLEREGEVIHVVAGTLASLDHHLGQLGELLLGELSVASRDFH